MIIFEYVFVFAIIEEFFHEYACLPFIIIVMTIKLGDYMANELRSLSDIFQNKLFRIPDYQRGYAWGENQLLDFWEDLTNLAEDRYHYTGLLSLKEIPQKNAVLSEDDKWLLNNGYKLFHVVDGQQRLTTFQILLNEIVTFVKQLDENKEKNNDEQILLGTENLKYINEKYLRRKRPPQNLITTYLFGYEIDNPSYEFLKYKIFNEPNSGTLQETFYTKNLMYAKSFFADVINKLYTEDGFDGVVSIFKKLTLHLMFNLHEIEDDYDVFVAFETMNNRGKRLSNLELLKNRLIYLTTLYGDSNLDEIDKDKLRSDINDAWKEVYFQLGRNQRSPLSDDEFLQAHWIMYFKYTRSKGNDYVNFLLNKFSAKNIFSKIVTPIKSDVVEPQFIAEEMDEEENNETTPIVWSKLKPKEIQEYVKSLKTMSKYWYYTYFPFDNSINGDISLEEDEKIWIDRLNRIGIAYFRPLLATILSKVKKTTAQERIAAYKAIERFIFVEFRLGQTQSTYKSSYYYLKTKDLLYNDISLKQLTEDLELTTNADSVVAIPYYIAKAKQNFISREGYYSWKALRYFLYEYEYQLSIAKNISKIEWNLFTKIEKDKVTIEHILPQTQTNKYWKDKFNTYNSGEMKIFTSTLGNLLPLSQSINSSLQNDSFDDKKMPPENKKRRGYVNGSHSEIEVAQQTEWNAESIYNRGLRLLEFLESRWNIKLTDEQKEALMYLEKVDSQIVVKK